LPDRSQSQPRRTAARFLRNPIPKLVFAATALAIIYLTLAPLALLVYGSLIDEPGRLPIEAGRLSLHNYLEVAGDPSTYLLLANTAVFTIGSTALGIGLAVTFAWLVERTDIRGRGLLLVGIVIPMAIPNMIYSSAWILLLNPQNGWINDLLRQAGLGWIGFNIYSLAGMILVQGLSLASHSYLLVAAPFRMLDPTWEEQSAIAGKGVMSTLRRITLPSLKPALLAAIIFFTVVNMETFDVPGTIGIPAQVNVFSTRIYAATQPEYSGLPDYGLASTLSLVLLVVAALLIWLYQRQTRHAKQFVTITGKGFRPRRVPLGIYRPFVTLAAFALVAVIVVLPVFMLIWRSLMPFYMAPSLKALSLVSLKAYADLILNYELGKVLQNTAIMAIAAASATTLLASLVAWLVLRAPVAAGWRSALNRLAFLPMAIPSIVLGLSFMFVYLTVPIPIYGTIWIIAIAMVAKYIPFSSGMMMAAQMQVASELEEASRLAGAGWARTYRRITFPLLSAALVNCFLWIVIHVVRELAVAVMLYSSRSEVLSTKVWSLWLGGWVAQASALGVLTIIALVLLLGLPPAFSYMRGKLRGTMPEPVNA
jgi:iron(III) transport system permease protein